MKQLPEEQQVSEAQEPQIANCISFNGIITTDLIQLEEQKVGFVLRGPNNEEFPLIILNSTKKESNATDHKKIDINVNNNSPTGNPIYVANNKKAVNKVIYCVLALLLGWIGAHKFYAGKVAAGILYLLFFWTCIPAIIAFIEFILALCKTEDSNGNILV